jgi:hypothetical protein
MKKTLLGAAVVVALSGGSAFAADAARPIFTPPPPPPSPLSGYVEIYGNFSTDEYWGSSYDPWAGIGGAARINRWMSPTSSLQFDFQANAQIESDSYYYGEYEVATFLHANRRTDTHLLGLFGGFAMSNDEGFDGWTGNFVGGLEAQAYLNNITLYGQVGVFKELFSYDEYDTLMWFGNFEARFFLTPNTKIAGKVGYHSGRLDTGDSYSAYNLGAEVEQKLGMSPVSLFGSYDFVHEIQGNYNINTFKIGARVMINQPNLLDQDRKGATLKVDMAPIYWQKGDYQ